MPFAYDPPPGEPCLFQGEVLGNVWLHRPEVPSVELAEGAPAPIRSARHARMILLHPDCDLAQDHRVRFAADPPNESHPKLVHEVILCDMFEEGEIIGQFHKLRDIWERAKRNQDERYHKLPAAPVGSAEGAATLPDLYMDFKRTYALTTGALYEGIRAGGVVRIARVPPVYLHDLMHRFYGYLSRVGLPD